MEQGVLGMEERAVFDPELSDNDLVGYLDESGSDDHVDTMDRLAMQKAASAKMISVDTSSKVQRHISHDTPGNTPPPVSPRYKFSHKVHKRKLSDKLDRLLGDRQNPQRLIQKGIMYTTPEVDIESVKEEIKKKRDEREKIKKRLKRKLSHDFRPTEQDIEDRGIKIVPKSIFEDEEDIDEEIIVYSNNDDRQSFSLQKKKSASNLNGDRDHRDGGHQQNRQQMLRRERSRSRSR